MLKEIFKNLLCRSTDNGSANVKLLWFLNIFQTHLVLNTKKKTSVEMTRILTSFSDEDEDRRYSCASKNSEMDSGIDTLLSPDAWWTKECGELVPSWFQVLFEIN